MSATRARLTLSGALFLLGFTPALAAPKVAVDIEPLQSIVARVMQGMGEPGLILPPGASPHGYALRPSDARLLEGADLVIWAGPALDPWMADPVASLAGDAEILTLEGTPGIALLPVRAGGPFEQHLHHDTDEATDDHAGHDHAEHDGHAGHDDHADHDDHGTHDDHDAHDHAEGDTDGHIWLDPENATVFAMTVAAALSAQDPENAALYAENAALFDTEMTALTAAINARLAPVRGKPFIVFHDAYQYFEAAFDFPAAGSVSLSEGTAPGAARVAEIRDRVIDEGVVCAFTEPQFAPKLLATVIEGTGVRTGVLDPVGAEGVSPGPDLYPALMLGLANSLATCLAE